MGILFPFDANSIKDEYEQPYQILTKENPTMENKTHEENYKGTAHMKAENQDMAFVNDVFEKEASEQTIRGTEEKSGFEDEEVE
jgi:hypothetical protein